MPDPCQVLFVCRGNTCRSPIAEALARTICTHPEAVRFRSAGIEAFSGVPASPMAVSAMRARGIDLLRDHRATLLTRELVESVDLIWTMTDQRREQIVRKFPRAAAKIERISESESFEDPIGGDLAEYSRLVVRMEVALRSRLRERGWL